MPLVHSGTLLCALNSLLVENGEGERVSSMLQRECGMGDMNQLIRHIWHFSLMLTICVSRYTKYIHA